MASSSTYTPVRTSVALLAVAAVMLSGCSSDDGAESEVAASPATSPVTTSEPGPPEPSAATSEDTTTSSAPAPDTSATAQAGTDEASAAATEVAAEDIVITIVDFAYELPDTVPPGATVTVVNEDTEAHTVTSSPAGAFGVTVTGGQSATFTAPDEPGEYGVICLFHGNMTATLVVG